MPRIKRTPRRNVLPRSMRQFRPKGARRARPARIGMTRRGRIYTRRHTVQGPMSFASRPGRIATRPSEKGNNTMVTKNHETVNSAMWSSGSSEQLVTDGSSQLQNWKSLSILLLAPPVPPTGTSQDKTIDNKAKYLGVNIHGKLSQLNSNLGTRYRVTVVEASENDTIPIGDTDYTTHNPFNRYFRRHEPNFSQNAVSNITFPNMRELPHAVHNTREYRILKQKYINFAKEAPGVDVDDDLIPSVSEKSFHFYVPMDRILVDSAKILAKHNSPTTFGGSVSQQRYGYVKPVFLVIEALFPNIPVTQPGDKKSANVAIGLTHNYKEF